MTSNKPYSQCRVPSDEEGLILVSSGQFIAEGAGLDGEQGFARDQRGSGGSCGVPDGHIDNSCCCLVHKDLGIPDDCDDIGHDGTSITVRVLVLRPTQTW